MALLLSLISKLLIWLIRSYQLLISPFLNSHCRFRPTCSQYSIEAISKFGILKSCWLILKRILKCHSLSSGGEDPIPPKKFRNREH